MNGSNYKSDTLNVALVGSGNQGSSTDGVRQACAWAWAGEIGEVRKVDVWSSRPIWPQGLDTPTDVQKAPKDLDWKLWIGHMPFRPYNSAYTPWNFRGWWDFGTGAFGDMVCHNMHPVFKVLNLGYPTSAQGQSTTLKKDACPHAQIVKMIFPARPNLPDMAMPEVEVTRYDGCCKCLCQIRCRGCETSCQYTWDARIPGS